MRNRQNHNFSPFQYPSFNFWNKETENHNRMGKDNLNNTINKLDLIVIYRTFPPTTAQYTLSSGTRESKSVRYQVLMEQVNTQSTKVEHKIGLDKFEGIQVIQSMFSDHNGTKLEINNTGKSEKFTNKQELHNTLKYLLPIHLFGEV